MGVNHTSAPMNLLPVAYDPTCGHPAFADRFDRSALGDEFATPGDALRRMKFLRDSGQHSCVIPARYHLAFVRINPYG